MRWPVLFLLTFALGLVQMFARSWVSFPAQEVHLELLLLIAFHAALRTRKTYIFAVFWWCGFVQDLFLGQRLGAHALLYLLPALLVAQVHGRVVVRHLIARTGLVLGLALVVCVFRPVAELQATRDFFTIRFAQAVLASGLYTAALSPVVGWLLDASRLHPAREEEASYGLPGAA